MIPLMPVPRRGWQEEYDAMMMDEFIARKTDRSRRLIEHMSYLRRHCPALEFSPSGVVIDIGPGCGETLEIAREWGHLPLGIDAPDGAGGMGDAYLAACRLMWERQGIPVERIGLAAWLAGPLDEMRDGAVLINSRGSIEQAFSDCMEGTPHDEHHDCRRLRWRFDAKTRLRFKSLFSAAAKLLRPGGWLLIHANGSANDDVYLDLLADASAGVPLSLEYSSEPLIRRWVRIDV